MVISTRLLWAAATGTIARARDIAVKPVPAFAPKLLHASAVGQLPAMSCVASSGVMLVAIAHRGARTGAVWALPVFWTGMLLLVAPVVARLVATTPARVERV